MTAAGQARPPFDGAPFGALIDQLLEERGRSRRDLATAVSANSHYIETLVREGEPNIGLPLLTRIAAELGVSITVFAAAAFGVRQPAQPLRVVAAGGAPALGRVLRAARVSLPASGTDVAAASGQHKNYISTLEQGAVTPRIGTLLRLTYSLVWDEEAHLALTARALQAFAGEVRPPRATRGLQGRRGRPAGLPPLRRYPYSR